MSLSEFSKSIRNRVNTNGHTEDDRSIQGGFFLRWNRGGKPPNWKEITEIIVAGVTAVAFTVGMSLLYKWLSKWLEQQ